MERVWFLRIWQGVATIVVGLALLLMTICVRGIDDWSFGVSPDDWGDLTNAIYKLILGCALATLLGTTGLVLASRRWPRISAGVSIPILLLSLWATLSWRNDWRPPLAALFLFGLGGAIGILATRRAVEDLAVDVTDSRHSPVTSG